MNHAEWIRRYHALMENAWTASVIVEPSPEETAAATLLAREIREGLAAGLLGQPLATHPPQDEPPAVASGPPSTLASYLADEQAAGGHLCSCRIYPTKHIHSRDERDEPNGEQADPIITQPMPGRIAQQLGDSIRAAFHIAHVPQCPCASCTTARKINAKVAERDALT